MSRSPVRRLLLLAALAFAAPAPGDHLTIHVDDAWARATPPAAEVGAAYFTLAAHGSGEDRLLGVSTPVAASAQMHTHELQGAMMRMRPMDAVEVHPQAPVRFAPGGNHVMLMGLQAPLVEGDRFPLTLHFEKAGAVVVDVHVTGAGAMRSAGAARRHGGHGRAAHPQMDARGHGHAGAGADAHPRPGAAAQ